MPLASGPDVHEDVRGTRLFGVGASAGQATGAARVLRYEADLAACLAGEILVMRHATPAVGRAARQAAGLVCETGGLLNHLAILAREMGTPCVTGVPGVIETLESGVKLRIDGSRGIVDALGTVAAREPVLPREAMLAPVVQFGRFSSTFEFQHAVLTPEAVVRAAALALLPEALELECPLAFVFDGNRVLVSRRRLRDLSRGAADRIEAFPASAALMRASYEDACCWSGWQHAAVDPRRALERFVLANCLTWVAAVAKEELAARLRRVIGAQVQDAYVADDLLLALLTTRRTSYLLAEIQDCTAAMVDLPAEFSADARADMTSRARALQQLMWLTEHKNTLVARLAVLMARLPVAEALGLRPTDLEDDGTAGGRAAMVQRVLEVMPRQKLPL